MDRYVSGPLRPCRVIDDWWGTGGPEAIVVHEAEPGPVATGLLDAAGQPIWRVREVVPMGFRAVTKG